MRNLTIFNPLLINKLLLVKSKESQLIRLILEFQINIEVYIHFKENERNYYDFVKNTNPQKVTSTTENTQ